MAELNFLVKVLTGTLDELARRAMAWGYDGIELIPDPVRVPEPRELEKALQAAGAGLGSEVQGWRQIDDHNCTVRRRGKHGNARRQSAQG
ncbi:MAG: hypothetical protein HYS33_05880 [Acidobacteria bacterium]|nr:hypothetical protein [Acidobacteriota bacterium]